MSADRQFVQTPASLVARLRSGFDDVDYAQQLMNDAADMIERLFWQSRGSANRADDAGG